MRCGQLGSGQATVIQVLMFMVLLIILSHVILNVLRPWTRLDTSSIVAARVAYWIEKTNGIIGLRFNQWVTIRLFANGTVLVETSRGVGTSKVQVKQLIRSSATGLVIYVISNETHAYVTSDVKGKS